MKFKENPKRLGRITKVHGVHGGLVVQCDQKLNPETEWPEWVFLEIDSGLVPFALKGDDCFEKDAHTLVIYLADYTNKEAAGEAIGHGVFFPADQILVNHENDWNPNDLPGYLVRFGDSDEVGEVIEWVDIPDNPLLKISYQGKEVLIPAQDEFIHEWDTSSRKIIMEIPDGLLDLE